MGGEKTGEGSHRTEDDISKCQENCEKWPLLFFLLQTSHGRWTFLSFGRGLSSLYVPSSDDMVRWLTAQLAVQRITVL